MSSTIIFNLPVKKPYYDCFIVSSDVPETACAKLFDIYTDATGSNIKIDKMQVLEDKSNYETKYKDANILIIGQMNNYEDIYRLSNIAKTITIVDNSQLSYKTMQEFAEGYDIWLGNADLYYVCDTFKNFHTLLDYALERTIT